MDEIAVEQHARQHREPGPNKPVHCHVGGAKSDIDAVTRSDEAGGPEHGGADAACNARRYSRCCRDALCRWVQNNFKPGGNGRPPVRLFIFSCSSASALRRASACAATSKSSRISFSSGLIS